MTFNEWVKKKKLRQRPTHNGNAIRFLRSYEPTIRTSSDLSQVLRDAGLQYISPSGSSTASSLWQQYTRTRDSRDIETAVRSAISTIGEFINGKPVSMDRWKKTLTHLNGANSNLTN